MKPYVTFLLRGMKILIALTLICAVGFFILAMKTRQMAEDVWTQLGIGVPQAHMDIKTSFIGGYLDYTGAKNAKNVVLGNRVAVVDQLVEYSKKHIKSEEFKKAYATYREALKPKIPEFFTETAEEIKAAEKIRLEQALKMAEQNLNSTNPKIKQGAPARIEQIKKEIAGLNDPANPAIKRRLDANKKYYDDVMKAHAQELEKYNTKLPEDPNVLLKKRLEEILVITADVDYDAELKDAFGKKVFVNPVYEKKRKEWKLAYRAGKTTTEAVRAAAERWLKEIK